MGGGRGQDRLLVGNCMSLISPLLKEETDMQYQLSIMYITYVTDTLTKVKGEYKVHQACNSIKLKNINICLQPR